VMVDFRVPGARRVPLFVLSIVAFPAPAGEQTGKAAGADGPRGIEEGKADGQSDQEAEHGARQGQQAQYIDQNGK
jgi:hypothetical protein